MAKSSSKEAKGEAPKKAGGSVPKYKREGLPRLRSVYQDQVRKELQEEFGYKNVMEIPRLVKITLNMGLGRAVAEPKLIDSAVEELRAISGRQPVVTVAKRDIATFKLRRGHKIGCMVTLRAEAMWEFLDRFVSIALPRVRDFRGVSPKAFDGRGNYSVGIREQIIFPEIDFDKVDVTKGLNITIVTTAKTDAEARSLLKRLGMPFRQPSSASAAASQGAQA